jgi:DNA mismatch repair protein MutS
VEAGYRVAIAEQISEPGKGLVEREVRRVVSKGTIVEPGCWTSGATTTDGIVAGRRGATAGIAYCDITTGEFAATQITAATRRSGAAHRRGTVAPAAERADPYRLGAGTRNRFTGWSSCSTR